MLCACWRPRCSGSRDTVPSGERWPKLVRAAATKTLRRVLNVALMLMVQNEASAVPRSVPLTSGPRSVPLTSPASPPAAQRRKRGGTGGGDMVAALQPCTVPCTSRALGGSAGPGQVMVMMQQRRLLWW